MKVMIDSNLKISNKFEPPLELSFESDSITLKNVLERLSNMCGSFEFVKSDGGLGRHIDVLFVNGKSCFSIERGLGTSLAEGDKVMVEISPEVLGGG